MHAILSHAYRACRSLIAPAGGRYKSRMEYDSRARGAKEAAAYMKKNPKSGTINPKDPKTW